MICKKCKQNISPDCCYDNNICVFCYHNITEWDSNGQLVTLAEAIRPPICPYCNRNIPNIQFLYKKGCQWCQKEIIIIDEKTLKKSLSKEGSKL
jgi:hypothetical protein